MDQYALRKSVSQRAFDARHPGAQAAPTAAQLDNALPASARDWLQQAAAQFGVADSEQRTFSRHGLLKLHALQVVMVCQSEEPLPLWLACGFMPAPPELHPDAWHQALLSANALSMGLNGISLGIDEKGNAQLTHRLAVDDVGDASALAALLNDFNSLASSLLDLLLSAASAAATPAVDAPAPPVRALPGWIAGWQQTVAGHLDNSVREALSANWHHPLLQAAREILALPAERLQLSGPLAELYLPERQISLTADGNGRHLLIMLPLTLPAPQGKALQTQLLASQGLFVMTNCTLVLNAEQYCLCSRWDSFGLDGPALAAWLADMMTLAVALELPPEAAHG